MNPTEIVNGIARKVEANCPPSEGDYTENGLLYCGKCKTPKQTRIALFEQTKIVPVMCHCAAEERNRAERQRREYERQRQIEYYRRNGFLRDDMQKWTFATDWGDDPRTINAVKNYVANFPEMKKNGKGLLLYGRCGSGKTFAAACAVNALIDAGYPCLMTNFSRIANTISGMYEKQKYLDSLNDYALLVLDDLGAERNTEYMNEIVFNIIDGRYRAGLPMIITSNLTIEELKRPKGIAEQRVFNRILERCFPLEVNGADRRKQIIRTDYDDMRQMLGL